MRDLADTVCDYAEYQTLLNHPDLARPILAKYGGWCKVTGERIRPGNLIVALAGGWALWPQG